jgi:hypothetical protein
MNQGEIVEELDGGGERRGGRERATDRHAGVGRQLRTNALALDGGAHGGVSRFAGGIDPAQVEACHASQEWGASLEGVERLLEFGFEVCGVIVPGIALGVDGGWLLGEGGRFCPDCRNGWVELNPNSVCFQ